MDGGNDSEHSVLLDDLRVPAVPVTARLLEIRLVEHQCLGCLSITFLGCKDQCCKSVVSPSVNVRHALEKDLHHLAKAACIR